MIHLRVINVIGVIRIGLGVVIIRFGAVLFVWVMF